MSMFHPIHITDSVPSIFSPPLRLMLSNKFCEHNSVSTSCFLHPNLDIDLRDFRLSRLCSLGIRSCGMWRRVAGQFVPYVSKQRSGLHLKRVFIGYSTPRRWGHYTDSKLGAPITQWRGVKTTSGVYKSRATKFCMVAHNLFSIVIAVLFPYMKTCICLHALSRKR